MLEELKIEANRAFNEDRYEDSLKLYDIGTTEPLIYAHIKPCNNL